MDKPIKPLSRLLLLVILVCGLSLQASRVNGVRKPSAPEFTLEVVESSYYVEPTYRNVIDQYTGKNVTVIDKPGSHVEKKTLYMTIKNQAFASYVNGTRCHMAYKVAYKGHFGEEWEERDFESQCTMTRYLSDGFPKASNSDYTVVYVCSAKSFPENTQLDVKVRAYIGHEAVINVQDYLPDHAFPIPAGSHDEGGIIFDTPGEWSEIQTITLNVPPLVEESTSILIGVSILIPVAAYLVGIVYIIKRKRSN